MLGVASGPRVGLAGCGGALGPPGGLLCRPFWGGGPGVGLALCCFVVCSAGRFVVCLSVCHFVLVFFGPFGVAVASLGWGGGGGEEGELVLVLFVRLFGLCLFGFVGFLFLLGSGGGGGGGEGAAVCDCGTP